jgi:hypothetical protein
MNISLMNNLLIAIWSVWKSSFGWEVTKTSIGTIRIQIIDTVMLKTIPLNVSITLCWWKSQQNYKTPRDPYNIWRSLWRAWWVPIRLLCKYLHKWGENTQAMLSTLWGLFANKRVIFLKMNKTKFRIRIY